MDIESLRDICKSLPFVTEDVKRDDDLCFLIGQKMFCVMGFNLPLKVSLKVTDEEFATLSNSHCITPAPYVARYKWILVEDANCFSDKELKYYITQSYNLVKSKLPKKILSQVKLSVINAYTLIKYAASNTCPGLNF